MVEQALLEDVGSGLAPVGPGWFVVNTAEAAWVRNEAFGWRCVFESSRRVLSERPDVDPQQFDQAGFTLAVLEPGKPTGMYHAESSQEDFLVLAGECLLLVEQEERPLRAWDFVHCPAGTSHTFVGTGTAPCVIFMIARAATPTRSCIRDRTPRLPTAPASRPRRRNRPRPTRRSPRGGSAGRAPWAICPGWTDSSPAPGSRPVSWREREGDDPGGAADE
jgi:quercetin dioxygenase-like cupin family protein